MAYVDIWWYVGSDLGNAPKKLPTVDKTIEGASIVPYRYHWNTGKTPQIRAYTPCL